jgi:FtsP/CotA-like multicopper oxidase with cupredoxin domain
MDKNRLLLTSTVIVLGVSLGGHFLTGIGGATAVPANKTMTPVGPVAHACPRPAAGSTVENPPALFSRGGVLKVSFSYQTRVDADGRNLFCFMTPDGLENPTLHVHPGDRLVINVTNNTPAAPFVMQIISPNCGASDLTGSSVNMHFHGTNTSPTCRQDEVIHRLINSGQTFSYDVHFPAN